MKYSIGGFLLLLLAHPTMATEPIAASKTEVSHAPVMGDPEAQKKSQALIEELEQTKKDILDKELHQRKVMSTLYEINRKMKKIVKDQSRLSEQRISYEISAKEAALKILSLEEKLKDQKANLRERLSAIYKLGGQGVARLIFGSSSSADLEKNLKILGIVAKRDLDLIKEYSANVKELDLKRQRFTKRLAKIKKLREEIKTQQSNLAQENNSKSTILENLRKSQQYSVEHLIGLRNKGGQLAAQDDSGVLDLLFRPSFFEKKKSLPVPVNGPITHGFGIVRDEDFNLSWSHKGVLFSVPPNTPVKSVFEGIVAFAGEIDGYGKTIIVDHGDHYYSVYGNNKELNVRSGQEISQSQVIAHSGYSNEDKADGLYFEIRHFSEPYDPRSWLKGSL